jgi:hypothetical protein
MQFPRTGLRLAFLSDSRCPGAKPDSPDGPDISRVGGTSPNLAIAPLAYPQRSATSEQRSQRPKGQANESPLERELDLGALVMLIVYILYIDSGVKWDFTILLTGPGRHRAGATGPRQDSGGFRQKWDG